jgi:hypothetical protein
LSAAAFLGPAAFEFPGKDAAGPVFLTTGARDVFCANNGMVEAVARKRPGEQKMIPRPAGPRPAGAGPARPGKDKNPKCPK